MGRRVGAGRADFGWSVSPGVCCWLSSAGGDGEIERSRAIVTGCVRVCVWGGAVG